MNPIGPEKERAPAPGDAARKRVAVETYSRHEATLRRTARRYSLCADDADDALQRALEILLRKAPSEDPRELIRWTQTVVKHEALAVRRDRERILSGPAARVPEPGADDWVALIPSPADGPSEHAERHEAVARSREALQALKPQELRALTLLAEGYSYLEIGELTGYSRTKINRCLAEGRERFRSVLSRSADGSRCTELGTMISAFCDGEVSAAEALTLREHLRACSSCRATLRAYRAAPAAAAALAPTLPVGRSLLDRGHEALAALTSRLGGGGSSETALGQIAGAGGTRGAGMAALAKALAICAGTVGGAAACVATGVVPAPLVIGAETAKAPHVKPQLEPILDSEPSNDTGVVYEPAPPPAQPQHQPEPVREEPTESPAPVSAAPESSAGAVEFEPPPPAPAAAAPSPSASSGGDPSGEFGP